MEGACVYINSYNNATLVMYKEYCKGRVFLLIYYNYLLYSGFTDIRTLSDILSKDSYHILTKLAFYSSILVTIEEWRKLAKEQLLLLNCKYDDTYSVTFRNKYDEIYSTSFKNKFSKKNFYI